MSRRRRVIHKTEKLDSRYGSPVVARLIAALMQNGKKSLAERIVYTAIEKTRQNSETVDPLEVLNKAVDNVRPRLEVKSRRVGGANYQVPVEVRSVRRMALAMRWLRDAARGRGEKSVGARLAGELAEAAEGRGGAMKKRDEVHRMAEANKAFSHYRF
jgi:small subunit ribosomal protein S7